MWRSFFSCIVWLLAKKVLTLQNKGCIIYTKIKFKKGYETPAYP